MGIRERLTDYSKGDGLRFYWKLFFARAAAQNKVWSDFLNLLCSRSAHRHGGYIGKGAVLADIPSLPHGLHGIYISRFAEIGKECRIYQNVTIGEVNRRAPKIGDRCLIGAGAVLVGGIRIGNDAKIGAGAVVSCDVPEGCTVVSPRPQVLGAKDRTASAQEPGNAGLCCAEYQDEAEKKRTRAWIELDRAALAHNIDVLRSYLPAGCRLMPAVKANAYGHGAVLVARQCGRLGIDAFCVASAKEGAWLRENQIQGEILVLGYTDPADFWMLERYRLSQTVLDCAYAEELNRYGKKLTVHMAVDTGMHRLGEDWRNIEGICRVFGLEQLNVEGMFTHLCAADSSSPADRDFTKRQLEAFRETADAVKRKAGVCPKLHLLSSDGIFHYSGYGADYARPGIALYGVPGSRGIGAEWEALLKPVLSLKARVASIKVLEAGESAGYGRAYVAEGKRRLAVLSVGYADGLPRGLSNGVGAVLLHGKKAPIAGRICMDQTLVDVTDIPQVRQGDIAVLIGRSGEACISACDLAEQALTVTNEILSRLGGRLERFWI